MFAWPFYAHVDPIPVLTPAVPRCAAEGNGVRGKFAAATYVRALGSSACVRAFFIGINRKIFTKGREIATRRLLVQPRWLAA